MFPRAGAVFRGFGAGSGQPKAHGSDDDDDDFEPIQFDHAAQRAAPQPHMPALSKPPFAPFTTSSVFPPGLGTPSASESMAGRSGHLARRSVEAADPFEGGRGGDGEPFTTPQRSTVHPDAAAVVDDAAFVEGPDARDTDSADPLETHIRRRSGAVGPVVSLSPAPRSPAAAIVNEPALDATPVSSAASPVPFTSGIRGLAHAVDGTPGHKKKGLGAVKMLKVEPAIPVSVEPQMQTSENASMDNGEERERLVAEEAQRQRQVEEAERERLAVEEAERERLAAEEAERERLAVEEAERERLAVEEAERQRQAAEEAERERLAVEEAERERLAVEEAERERLAVEEAERERLAVEEAERQRQAAEEAECERQRQVEEAERERLAVEEAERERLAVEEAERQRQVEEAERERLAVEEAERERLAVEEAERQRQAAEEAECERQRQVEEAERERLAVEEAERQRLAAEEAERQRQVEEAKRERLAVEEAERERLAVEEAEHQQLAAGNETERDRSPSKAAITALHVVTGALAVACPSPPNEATDGWGDDNELVTTTSVNSRLTSSSAMLYAQKEATMAAWTASCTHPEIPRAFSELYVDLLHSVEHLLRVRLGVLPESVDVLSMGAVDSEQSWASLLQCQSKARSEWRALHTQAPSSLLNYHTEESECARDVAAVLQAARKNVDTLTASPSLAASSVNALVDWAVAFSRTTALSLDRFLTAAQELEPHVVTSDVHKALSVLLSGLHARITQIDACIAQGLEQDDICVAHPLETREAAWERWSLTATCAVWWLLKAVALTSFIVDATA